MITLKRGDTFSRTYRLVNQNVSDWSEWQGRGQIRAFFADGELLGEFVFDWLDAATGLFQVSFHETQDWPVGKHFFDVEFSLGNFKFSTPTSEIEVISDVTKDA